ncbi:MAG: hypothetical protein VX733_07110 [Candidatus Latescibacterota bacterium]|nr:hypothetical protein [Candidatus Latescibacterota bacterium]
MNDSRPEVTRTPPARFRWQVERITDNAGCKLSGGSGASGWGYNHSNIVRCRDDLFALSWRDDLTLALYRRVREGNWEQGPVFPPVPQNGNLLVDDEDRMHIISGDRASWHVRFDEPGRMDRFELRRRWQTDSRFGAAVEGRRIFVGGGLEHLDWVLLDGDNDYEVACFGEVRHERARGYHFVVLADSGVHTFCSDDYFLAGKQFPNQQITIRDSESGEPVVVDTDPGIYPVLRAYYYHNPDPLSRPNDWRVTVMSDVSDTFRPPPEGDGSRGTTDHQDLYLDSEGELHLLYYENRQPSREVWAAMAQDPAHSRLYHAVGSPGGPFCTWCLGAFNSGRILETTDGRMHFFLTMGRRSAAQSLWYTTCKGRDWSRMSEPVQLDTGSGFWHFFIAVPRAGSTVSECVDGYWHGPFGGNSNEVFYGRLTPG